MRIIPKWMETTDEGTWIGHWVAGLLGFWPGFALARFALGLPVVPAVAAGILTGVVVVVGVFAYREGDNMRAAIKKLGSRMAIKTKGLDGVMDLTMPVLGTFADIQLVTGTFADFLVAVVGAALVFGIVVAYRRRLDIGPAIRRLLDRDVP